MAVRVNVKKDLKGVTKRVSQMTKLGQYALVNQVHADANQYAPFRSGDLRNQSSISTDGKQIIWHVPYAKRQYYNYGAKFTTPGTGPKWDAKAQALHQDSWIRVVKKAMK
jgi:hypothetical protein